MEEEKIPDIAAWGVVRHLKTEKVTKFILSASRLCYHWLLTTQPSLADRKQLVTGAGGGQTVTSQTHHGNLIFYKDQPDPVHPTNMIGILLKYF